MEASSRKHGLIQREIPTGQDNCPKKVGEIAFLDVIFLRGRRFIAHEVGVKCKQKAKIKNFPQRG
jgi:hypothetical protein